MSKDEIRNREKEKMVLAQSQAGPIEAVPNLKRRKLAVYWRPHTNPDGTTEWIQTRPLPVDTLSKELYFNKGFRLEKPSEVPVPEVDKDDEKEALVAEVARLTAKVIQLESKPIKRRAKSSE